MHDTEAIVLHVAEDKVLAIGIESNASNLSWQYEWLGEIALALVFKLKRLPPIQEGELVTA